MKDKDVNTYRFIVLLLGATVGSVISLIVALFILHLYREKQLKKSQTDLSSDIEEASEISNLCKKGKGLDNISSKKSLFSFSRNSKRKLEKEYSCANNNTQCSNNMGTLDNDFDISSISSNDSENFVVKNSKKYTKLQCQNQMLEYTKRHFSPICTSSPIPKTSHIYSTNDTFSITKPTNQINSSSYIEICQPSSDMDSDVNYYKINPINHNDITPDLNQNTIINSITRASCNFRSKSKFFLNSSNSVLNYISDDEKQGSELKANSEYNLFDPKNVSDEFQVEDNRLIHSSTMINIVPLCCQRRNNLPKVFNANFRKLCETFAESGSISSQSMDEEFTQEIMLLSCQPDVIIGDGNYFITTSMVHCVVWFMERDFLDLTVTLQIVDHIERTLQSFDQILSTLVKFEVRLDIKTLVFRDSKRVDSNVILVNKNYQKSTINIDSDNSWRGRSRQTIRK